MFKPVSPKVDFPKLEEEILKNWKEHKIFEKSIESRPKDKTWTFLDGPPFITGLPHYGTLLVSIPKDVFPRFWTMRGYRVRRVWGWDVHGLPAENKVEVGLGIKRKRDIEEKIGVKRFIEECRTYVSESSKEWEWYIDHIARWVDFKHAYKTMDLSYMETVMWVFQQMYEKGLIYKGLRVSLYCPHCATPISNFEVAMDPDNYKEIFEQTAVYKYKLKAQPFGFAPYRLVRGFAQGESEKRKTTTQNSKLKNIYLLAWSTTPWNKLVTTALAVNPELMYVEVVQGNEHYILAKETLKMLKEDLPYKVLRQFKGTELIECEFEPHYDFYSIDPGKKALVVVGGDFVTAEEGTGIVTIAPYGEEDLAVMQKENIQIVLHVDEEGILKKEVPTFGGMYYLEADEKIIDDLRERGLIYRLDSYTHSIPTCWRCHTRLLYAPQDAWFVDVQRLKPAMKKTNEIVNWFPKHFKYGRFLNSLEAAPDWCISRSRYWGSPVPVWECECGERFVPGSIKELEERSGRNINDLHKPEIDEVTVACSKCKKQARRVPEVLDSWIEAGSASFAERHYPFEKGLELEEFFPPDFIVEYTGQIRAWFYVLHVIATALFDSHAFKNVVVTGVILGTDGRKMSKNFGNYPDPKEMLQKYGGDALRLYLMGSPVMHGEDILISEEKYREQVKGLLLILWNVYNFFVSNANVDNWQPKDKTITPKNILDEWMLSRLNGNIRNIRKKGYEMYDTPEVAGQAWIFMRDLSLWYVRRIRDRVGPTAENKEDKESAYKTLYKVLVEYSKALAPLIPFVTEEIYRNLTGQESVHLADWPADESSADRPELEIKMNSGMKLASKVHALRKEAEVKVRIPLRKLVYKGPEEISSDVLSVVLSEVNVYELVYEGESQEYEVSGDTSEKNQDLISGQAREIVRQIQQERKRLGTRLDEHVVVELLDWPKSFEEEIKKKALVRSLIKGKEFRVLRV